MRSAPVAAPAEAREAPGTSRFNSRKEPPVPSLTRPEHTYLGAEVPLDIAAAFKQRAAEAERSATAQLRLLIREFALNNDERRPAMGGVGKNGEVAPREPAG